MYVVRDWGKEIIYLASTGWRSWENAEISTIAHMP